MTGIVQQPSQRERHAGTGVRLNAPRLPWVADIAISRPWSEVSVRTLRGRPFISIDERCHGECGSQRYPSIRSLCDRLMISDTAVVLADIDGHSHLPSPLEQRISFHVFSS